MNTVRRELSIEFAIVPLSFKMFQGSEGGAGPSGPSGHIVSRHEFDFVDIAATIQNTCQKFSNVSMLFFRLFTCPIPP